MRVNWKNVPIPEGHLIPLIVGGALEAFYPRPLGAPAWARWALGLSLALGGLLLVAWCVREVNAVDLEDPQALVTGGPYARSRNPMYLGWTAIYLGVLFWLDSLWPLLALPLALLYTHYFVLKEEKWLEARFGDEYRAYRRAVRRYL